MSADSIRTTVDGGVAEEAEPPLERLRGLLLEDGGLMSGLVRVGDLADPPTHGPAQIVAAGPRAEGSGAEYELLVETIYEGYLLHYHTPRIVREHEADLGLLAGDRLYALGLALFKALTLFAQPKILVLDVGEAMAEVGGFFVSFFALAF